DVSQGRLRGITADGVHSFKGIPYALAPVADLRWAPTQPARAWEGIRDAGQFGSDCMQEPRKRSSPYFFELTGPSEDCLFLNIWSSSMASERRAPVMVWIHGGSHTRGSGSEPNFNGAALARQGVVLVTINYRLNVFGYMPHEELSAEQGGHSGNYGLYDQVAALEWVRDNIDKFGGDSGNVTIFGVSAGSSSVNQLVVNPAAKGLFHRTIGQSGGIFHPMKELASGTDSGHARGARMATALNVSSLKAMREVGEKDLLTAYGELAKQGYELGVIMDGKTIPGQAIDLFRSGNYNQVPTMVGYNRDEATTLSQMPFLVSITKDREGFSKALDMWAPQLKDQILAAYPAREGGKTHQPQHDFFRDVAFGWNMQTWARLNEEDNNPAWLYFFTRQPPTPNGQKFGAYHGVEKLYVFGNGVADTPEDQTLSQQMQRYWVNFARYGDPNGKEKVSWPRFGSEGHYLQLKPGPEPGKALNRETMALIDKANGL
ncbi:MAG: para-nitrobenzyl esterase, partial [Candidatus Azotimanducaceae bacterium]